MDLMNLSDTSYLIANPLAPFIHVPEPTKVKNPKNSMMAGNFQVSTIYQYKPIIDEYRERYAMTT
jgi:hypothetical protein